MKNFRSELQRIMKKSGFELTETQLDQFVTYRNELKRWNKKINLTAIRDDKGIIEKHFLDSISLLHYVDLPFSAKVADVGSGAGFPGLPLKLLRPDLNFVLIESAAKKASFLNFIIASMFSSQFRFSDENKTLKLTGVKVANVKAEEFMENKSMFSSQFRFRKRANPVDENKFDIVLTRFLASIADSVEYCVKLLKSGGLFVAYKSSDVQTEIRSARPKIDCLRAEVVDLIRSDMPQDRCFVVIRAMM